MATKHDFNNSRRLGIILSLLVCCFSSTQAFTVFDRSLGDEMTIDYEIEGWVMVMDTTVNLVDGAWIKDSPSEAGQLWATQGAVVNIYGGQIDDLVVITTTESTTLPEAQVTVYGSEFVRINAQNEIIPIDPNTTELFLEDEILAGVYEDGTAFAFHVDCYSQGDFKMFIKLGWVAGAPEIDVWPDVVDFGEVEIGQQASAFVTVANIGNTSLTLQGLEMVQGDEQEFGIVPLAQMPVTLEPDETIEIELVYTPMVEGPASAVLLIGSDDPEMRVREVLLGGDGVAPEIPELTPRERIDAICAFYMTGLQNGTIEGVGRGRSAKNKTIALGHMLISARHLINGGYDRLSLIVLYSVEKKTDGMHRPPDFVEGPSVPVLNEMVNDLIEAIRNQ